MRDPSFTQKYEAEVETFGLDALPDLPDEEAIGSGFNPANLVVCIAGYEEQVRTLLLAGVSPADEERIVSQLERALASRLQLGFGCRSYSEALFISLPGLRMSSLGVPQEVGWTELIGCALLIDLKQFATQAHQPKEETMRQLHATMVQGMVTASLVSQVEATPNPRILAKALFPAFDEVSENAVKGAMKTHLEKMQEGRYGPIRKAKRAVAMLFTQGKAGGTFRHGRWKTYSEAAAHIAPLLEVELTKEEVAATTKHYGSTFEAAVEHILVSGAWRR